MSGRGRKQPHRGGKARGSQAVARKGAGGSRTAIPSPRREQVAAAAAARPAAPQRTRDTRPVAEVSPRRAPATSPGAERAARRERAERKKRNQRYGVIIGAVALGGAAIGGVIAGMAGGAEPTDGTTGATSSVFASAGPTAGPSADAAAPAPASEAPAPAGITITCPTDGGASPVFGHDILVPEPYTITIDYGDGDVYTNDSAHLGAIFSHTYAEPGTYTVNAELKLPVGATTTATCDYTW